MAMKKLEHVSHECVLTSPKILANVICNICYKDEPGEFACIPCNFDLCKACSDLPPQVSHEFHSEHPLDFCLRKVDQEPVHIICSCCGNMSSGSYYKCKDCEIYLDLSCALLPSIFRSWDAEEKLHYSHAHLLKRCRPGPDARGSCLLCELPLSPSAICYGCLHCYSFVHESCLDFPIEIQHHPVHPAHPLKRLDYTQNCGPGIDCGACGNMIASVPIGCLECRFYLHMRCADSLLRGLMHKSHEHKLFYKATGAVNAFPDTDSCELCTGPISLDSYYHCLECGWTIHFECLRIPKFVVQKNVHIHPLVCKIFHAEDDDSLEYCGVCETMVHVGHHAYSCEECILLCHIECILRKEVPSPMYLKALYSCGKDVAKGTCREDCETNKLESELMVNDIGHIHVLKLNYMDNQYCKICQDQIFGNPWKCETCEFQAHDYCAELGQPSRHRLHRDHDLTLLPSYPAGVIVNCNTCKEKILGFNLLCRTCNLITCMRCVVRFNQFTGVLRRGQKVIGATELMCKKHNRHYLLEVMISVSYLIKCFICDERLCGKVLSCMECGDIYHRRCTELQKHMWLDHPLHSHSLRIEQRSGFNCTACKLNITKSGLFCYLCEVVGFHIKCCEGVDASGKRSNFHTHTFYNFWIDDDWRVIIPVCIVCGRSCGASFYGCIDCSFCAHVECLGFPEYVKNQQHQHTVIADRIIYMGAGNCALCGSQCPDGCYSCIHCKDVFHKKCLMSMDDREAATEEKQRGDVLFMYIERFLIDIFETYKKEEEEDELRMAKRNYWEEQYAYDISGDDDGWDNPLVQG